MANASAEKRARNDGPTRDGIRSIFDRVAGTYELANHVLTFGLDIAWRKRLARLAVRSSPGRCLDVCAGTGETAFRIRSMTAPSSLVAGVDFSKPMLDAAARKRRGRHVGFILADARRLPFATDSFDVATISFALRNLNVSREELINAFREIRRVLRPGGMFLSLETTQPRVRLVRFAIRAYVRLVVAPVGALISGTRPAYAYLAHTIPRFYSAPELADILREAGFPQVNHACWSFGLVAVHEAVK